MKIVLFLVLFCIVTYCNASDRQRGRVNWRGKRREKIKVNFSLPNCQCNGYEGGGHGRGPRPFRIVCKRNRITNDCTFTGNPHRCSDYNNNNQRRFYQELIDVIAPQQCGNLNLPGYPCPTGTFNTRRTCTEIDYN